jgi:hypothetical protein
MYYTTTPLVLLAHFGKSRPAPNPAPARINPPLTASDRPSSSIPVTRPSIFVEIFVLHPLHLTNHVPLLSLYGDYSISVAVNGSRQVFRV